MPVVPATMISKRNSFLGQKATGLNSTSEMSQTPFIMTPECGEYLGHRSKFEGEAFAN